MSLIVRVLLGVSKPSQRHMMDVGDVGLIMPIMSTIESLVAIFNSLIGLKGN